MVWSLKSFCHNALLNHNGITGVANDWFSLYIQYRF